MTSIGPQLRTARERRGISAADAAKRLHMRAMFVEALEREDWVAVGEPVYVRGFIRNYARMLGLDSQLLVEAFNETTAVEDPHTGADGLPIFESRPRFRHPWLLTAMSGAAIVLVLMVVWALVEPRAAGHDELRPPPAAAVTTTGMAQTLAASKSEPAQSGVNLRLALTQPCWLSVSVDGKRVVYQTLPAGTVKDFHGDRQITLRAGNAGGVVATINGQSIGTLGSAGQVRDRVFAVKTPPIGQNGFHE